MDFIINKYDLEEIESKEPELASWLTSHFSSFSACAFILQSVMNGVNDAKTRLKLIGEFENGK